jgi:hypothetical protein
MRGGSRVSPAGGCGVGVDGAGEGAPPAGVVGPGSSGGEYPEASGPVEAGDRVEAGGPAAPFLDWDCGASGG